MFHLLLSSPPRVSGSDARTFLIFSGSAPQPSFFELITSEQGWTLYEILRYVARHDWSAYEEALKTNPVLAKMVISGVVYSLGDGIPQATVVNLVVGSLVWVEDDMACIDGKVVHVNGEEIKIICTNEKGDDVGDQWREEPWNYLFGQVFQDMSLFQSLVVDTLSKSSNEQAYPRSWHVWTFSLLL